METTTETIKPVTTTKTTEVTTIPSSCNDVKPVKQCKKLASKIENLKAKLENKCKKSLKQWFKQLSEKEVCDDKKMLRASESGTNLDKRMDSCVDTWPKQKCKKSLKKLNKQFNNLAKKCAKTAKELKKNLLMTDVDC